ncbi:hypothetical protein OPV22_002714 [Ensete ventricosum]|uniref:Uncharacterized protein n=1 Tax=Ensete ventricosum TaxID=4639 RepID=A0AAV8RYK3_ENSVE|nr:hypothetical protein OPV22_002714 [Ensete ventricosum]
MEVNTQVIDRSAQMVFIVPSALTFDVKGIMHPRKMNPVQYLLAYRRHVKNNEREDGGRGSDSIVKTGSRCKVWNYAIQNPTTEERDR